MATDATLDHLERDEALDIGAELGEIFSRRAGAVPCALFITTFADRAV